MDAIDATSVNRDCAGGQQLAAIAREAALNGEDLIAWLHSPSPLPERDAPLAQPSPTASATSPTAPTAHHQTRFWIAGVCALLIVAASILVSVIVPRPASTVILTAVSFLMFAITLFFGFTNRWQSPPSEAAAGDEVRPPITAPVPTAVALTHSSLYLMTQDVDGESFVRRHHLEDFISADPTDHGVAIATLSGRKVSLRGVEPWAASAINRAIADRD